MSGKAIKKWLADHSGELPAYDLYHRKVAQLINQGIASLGEVADAMMFDPGMTVALLHRVNSKLKKSRRRGVDNLHSAAGLLGKPAVANLISQQQKFSSIDAYSASSIPYRQLLNQNFHALQQLEMLSRIQGIGTIEDMRTAVLLYSLGELQVILQDPETYRKFRYMASGNTTADNAAQEFFGFTFRQLTRTLAYSWNLPELLIESLDDSDGIGRKARLVQQAGEIAYQAESGWYCKPMYTLQKKCADFHNVNGRIMTANIHNTAILAARVSPYSEVIHPAARLIHLAEPTQVQKPVAQVKPAVKTPSSESVNLADKIKASLASSGATQSTVLNLLLNGLHQHTGFDSVVLMLLSGDKKNLQTRTGKGLESNPAFGNLKLEVSASGLIKTLLQKPQALLINGSNYRKYQSLLPGQFKAACMCDNFVMMSIFIGDKPVGVIYCDRQKNEQGIDAASYDSFKSSVTMTSKALTYLVKRNAKSAA